MSEHDHKSPRDDGEAGERQQTAREQRLAKALRDNLRRRKAPDAAGSGSEDGKGS